MALGKFARRTGPALAWYFCGSLVAKDSAENFGLMRRSSFAVFRASFSLPHALKTVAAMKCTIMLSGAKGSRRIDCLRQD